jgi:hypothetical protein
VGVARLYADIVSALIIDTVDADLADQVAAAGVRPIVTDTIMSQPGVGAGLVRATLGPL